MDRLGAMRSAGLRAVSVMGLALVMVAAPRPATAQEQPAAAPPQEDQLKFASTTPILLINQIKAEKAADFEQAWASMRAAFLKVEKAEVKALGDTLNKLYKVDLPPGQGAVIYVFQLDAPSTAFSYNPVKILYDVLHGNGALTREEADAIYAKLKDAYQSINPWPIVKVG